ncbi:MAG: helix-turn-helix domain-containing protein [Treponema sp.]|jgi:transcriptional regulator with XRE-family HTH domain|nr:helix-turn-helix domain-containing protein [Treponema sp.]
MDYKDNDIGERIKELRSILKLSQVKFAEAIHISKGYQAQLELMQAPASDRVIALIAAAFNVNEAWLRNGEGAMFTRAATPPSTPAEKLERMTAVFNELYPEFQDYILNQIDQLIVLQNLKREQ